MPTGIFETDQNQLRFLTDFVLAIEKYRKRNRIDFRSSDLTCFTTPPRLMLDQGKVTLEFDYKRFNELHESYVQIGIGANPFSNAKSGQGKPPKPSRVAQLSFECECDRFQYLGFCRHIASCMLVVEHHIRDVPVAEAYQWLESRICDENELNARLLRDLQRCQSVTEYRVQWRATYEETFYSPSVHIDCYLQKKKANGRGWSAGRRVGYIFEEVPNSAYRHPHDYSIAAFLQMANSADPPQGFALSKAMDLLKDHPDFCWNMEGFPSVKVIHSQATLEFREDKGAYEPTLMVDGQPYDQLDEIPPIECGTFCVLLPNRLDHTLKYFELTVEDIRRLQVLQSSHRRGLKLNPNTALEISRLLAPHDAVRSLIAKLPESLSGPEVALPPKIELHLVPRFGGGLEIGLRVSCEGLDVPPLPGMGACRLPVTTLAGPVQYIRDLPMEAATAEQYAQLLGLGDYPFDNPYTWLSNDIEQSMTLLQRCRELGENGPIVCWPASKPLRLLGEITPQCLKVRLTSERDWFGLEGELCIDDLQVPLAELFAALRSGSRFVPLGDGGFATISQELRQRLSAMDDLVYPERSGMTVSRAAATMVREAIGQDIPAEVDQRWHDAIERLSDRTHVPSKPPRKLHAELRDYQMAGYQWLSQLSHWGLGGCLADDMGLGKTVQALGVLLDRSNQGPALIIAPTSVGSNWLRETEKFAPTLTPHLYREYERDELIKNVGNGDLVIASYQLVQRDIERFASRQWGTLILDEAQYIKNFQTKTCAAIRQIDTKWPLALTGTPLENHLGELWSLMRVISPGLLGSWDRFRSRFAEPIERHQDRERLLALGKILRPFMLRRTKQEVLTELPPRTEVVQTVELSAAERKRYDAARLAALAELSSQDTGENDQQRRIKILAWLTRLRQLACHPGLVDPRWKKSSAKLNAFMDIVKELVESQHRALVFSQFVQHLTLVRKELDDQGIAYQYLDGSTPPAKRQAAVEAFQRGEGDLFLISLKAGGTGLNLTGADYVLHLDPWWNPAVEDQATDRAHRIGQTQKVTVFRMVAKDTIEEQILSLHASKRELIAGVLDGADRAAKLSTDELVSLIRLGVTDCAA